MLHNSKKYQLESVAARFRRQYGSGPNSDIHGHKCPELDALDPKTATPEDVARIIGNESWCTPQRCHECNDYSWDTVTLGEPPDYESSTATICVGCLRKAVALVEDNPDA